MVVNQLALFYKGEVLLLLKHKFVIGMLSSGQDQLLARVLIATLVLEIKFDF